jgi:DNA-binding beta-propeller fold protein YncE
MRNLKVSAIKVLLLSGILAASLLSSVNAMGPLMYDKLPNIAKDAFRAILGMCIDKNDNIYACGDNKIKVFSRDGKEIAGWTAPSAVECLAVDKDGFVYAAGYGKVIKYSNNKKGEIITSWGTAGDGYGQIGNLSSITTHDNFVLLLDAGNSCIHKYSSDGKFIEDIGRAKKSKRGSFSTCCGIFDAAVDSKGKIYVANLGAHRVEIVDPANPKAKKFWGQAGDKPEEFCGCCNPTNIAIASNGDVITSEKSIPRVKIYSPEGKLKVLIGADNFSRDCANMFVAVDSKNNIYVVDNTANCIRVFSIAK